METGWGQCQVKENHNKPRLRHAVAPQVQPRAQSPPVTRAASTGRAAPGWLSRQGQQPPGRLTSVNRGPEAPPRPWPCLPSGCVALTADAWAGDHRGRGCGNWAGGGEQPGLLRAGKAKPPNRQATTWPSRPALQVLKDRGGPLTHAVGPVPTAESDTGREAQGSAENWTPRPAGLPAPQTPAVLIPLGTREAALNSNW